MNRISMLRRPASVAFLALCISASPVLSQSTLENALRQFGSENAKGYLQPLADLFAADMSSGWYAGAAIPRSRPSFHLEFIGMGSAVEDKHKTFVARAPEGFTPATFTTATVFGGEGATVPGPNSTQFSGSDGILDADYFPTAAPQIRLGGFLGTEVIARWFSSSVLSFVDEEDFPEIDLLGVGVRHSISQYIPAAPLDLSVGVFYTSFNIGEDEESGVSAEYSGLAFGVQASRSFSVLTLFAGVASDGGDMDLSYTSTNPDEAGRVNIELPVDRAVKFTAGAELKLGFFKLFGDASFGPATTFSGGLRLGR